MNHGTVLVVDPDPRERASVVAALDGVVGEVEGRDAFPVDPEARRSLLLTNVRDLSADRGPVADAVSTGGPGAVIGYARDLGREELAELLGDIDLMNLLARDAQAADLDLKVTVRKALSADIFGIDAYFPAAVRRHSFSLRAASGKAAVLAGLDRFAEHAGVRRRLRDKFWMAADEVITNALFNSPVDATGRPLYAHVPRNQAICLPPGRAVEVVLCSGGGRLGLSVTDPFGRLRPSTVVQSLARGLSSGARATIDEAHGGAGLGLYFAFQALSHLVFNIQPGVRTEVVGLLDVASSYREFARAPKSFNVFAC